MRLRTAIVALIASSYPLLERGERANAPAHRERPQCVLSALAQAHRGRDAVERWVRRSLLLTRPLHSVFPFAVFRARRPPRRALRPEAGGCVEQASSSLPLRHPERSSCSSLNSEPNAPSHRLPPGPKPFTFTRNRKRAAIRCSGWLDDTYRPPYDDSSRRAFASCKSFGSNPSVNQP